MDIKDIHKNAQELLNKELTINGWIKNNRNQKTFGFIDFNDGTLFKSIQVVYDENLTNFEEVSKFLVGCALEVIGTLVESQGNQDYELKANNIKLLGSCPEDYPLQPKRHTREFLREIAYLRPRTNLFNAVFRVRSLASQAIHNYFQDRNYIYLHSPIITSADAEGAGEMFQVTTLDLKNISKTKENDIDYKKDFFNKKVSLTVSGQLQGEIFAHAFKKIYTFGPTFRAENSNTKTHASEFWMIEPEIAFCDLKGNMEIIEDMIKYVVKDILEKCPDEIEMFNKFVLPGVKDRLEKLVKAKFNKVTHEEAINILLKSDQDWEFIPEHGGDLAKEHEKYLTDTHFNGPVFITDWPKDIKAFYMKLNPDNKTVAAVDLLVPEAGELIGGSQREEDHDKLLNRMKEMNIHPEELEWYLNLRRYGGTIHSGFGMGFERLLIYLTGVDNIRDVIPFPRTPKSCEF